jgi:ribosomal protein S18 acetylase RimI-like enzyme
MTLQPTVPLTVRKATPTDQAALVAALAGAFFDDPVFRWCFPDDWRRWRVLPGFFELAVEIFARHDQTWGAGSPVVGAALWSPAGVMPMTETEGEMLAERMTELAGPDADRLFEVVALLDDNHPHHADHDYLWLLAVHPAWQGRGLGSAMLRAGLAGGEEAGVPAYLEATSPTNRRLYEQHGFEVIGELAIAGGPPLWPMWRDPRPSDRGAFVMGDRS